MLLCFYAVYLLAPLPFGSNRDWAWLLLAALTFLMCCILCVNLFRGKARLSKIFSTPMCQISIILFVLVILWQIIQCIPLPITWLEYVPTPSSKLYSQAYAIINKQSPLMGTISVDASVSEMMVLKSIFYFCLYLLLLQLINSRKRLKKFCYLIVFSGLFQALFGSFMMLSDIEYLFAIKKESYIGFATGTFVARNHFAGYLEMTISVALGLMITHFKMTNKVKSLKDFLRQILQLDFNGKIVLNIVIMIMIIGLILSGSRMGNIALILSFALSGMITILMSPLLRKLVNRKLVIIMTSFVLLVGILYFDCKLSQRLENTDLSSESRFHVQKSIIPMIHDFNWFGSGAGTFKYIYPSYMNGDYCCFMHAHNDYLELITDVGFIGFFMLAGIVVISLKQALIAILNKESNFVRGIGFAGLMGSLSLLIHGLMDFNLQIPANAMLFIALLTLPSIAISVYRKGNNLDYATIH